MFNWRVQVVRRAQARCIQWAAIDTGSTRFRLQIITVARWAILARRLQLHLTYVLRKPVV